MLYFLLSNLYLYLYSVSSTTLLCDGKTECQYDTVSGDDYDSLICTGYKACRHATITVDNVTCDGEKGCQNANIEGTQLAECGGDYGCRYATLEVDELICDGEYSCPRSDIEVPADGTLECNGYGSCRYNIDTEDANLLLRGTLTCGGENSCEYSYIEVKEDSDNMYCSGKYSCFDIQIDIADSRDTNFTITSTGEHGLDSGVIYSGEDNSLIVDLSGYYAANDLEIYCESGSTCTVTCDGLSCYNTYVYYDEDATTDITCTCDDDDEYYCAQAEEWDTSKKGTIKKNKIKSKHRKEITKPLTTDLNKDTYKKHLKYDGERVSTLTLLEYKNFNGIFYTKNHFTALTGLIIGLLVTFILFGSNEIYQNKKVTYLTSEETTALLN